LQFAWAPEKLWIIWKNSKPRKNTNLKKN